MGRPDHGRPFAYTQDPGHSPGPIIRRGSIGQMTKKNAEIGTFMPSPNVIVSCRGEDGFDNALVVGYACNCSYDPPMVMVGIVPSRYSYELVKQNPCYVVHFARTDQKEAWDYLGSESGRDGDKLAHLGLTVEDGEVVNAPVITDFPVAVECSVVDSIMTGSHEMFAGKIEAIHADEELVDEDGKLDMSAVELI